MTRIEWYRFVQNNIKNIQLQAIYQLPLFLYFTLYIIDKTDRTKEPCYSMQLCTSTVPSQYTIHHRLYRQNRKPMLQYSTLYFHCSFTIHYTSQIRQIEQETHAVVCNFVLPLFLHYTLYIIDKIDRTENPCCKCATLYFHCSFTIHYTSQIRQIEQETHAAVCNFVLPLFLHYTLYIIDKSDRTGDPCCSMQLCTSTVPSQYTIHRR